ncbi:hypothetical protein ACHAQA_010081 [Verticillium albo-atrum]
MFFSTSLFSAALAASAIATPVTLLGEAHGIEKRCTWEDPHHNAHPCDSFTVRLGGLHPDDVLILGPNFNLEGTELRSAGGSLKCNGGDIQQPNPSGWVSFTSPLPWTVEFKADSACGGDPYFKYARLDINMKTDTRCRDINKNTWWIFGHMWHCVIPIRP